MKNPDEMRKLAEAYYLVAKDARIHAHRWTIVAEGCESAGDHLSNEAMKLTPMPGAAGSAPAAPGADRA